MNEIFSGYQFIVTAEAGGANEASAEVLYQNQRLGRLYLIADPAGNQVQSDRRLEPLTQLLPAWPQGVSALDYLQSLLWDEFIPQYRDLIQGVTPA